MRRVGQSLVLVLLAIAVPGTAAGATLDVNIQGGPTPAFQPDSVTVDPGDTVHWTNLDSVTHTVTSNSGAFGSPFLAQNDEYSHAFATSGTFSYHCSLHPSMTGTVTVTGVAPPPGPPTPAPTPGAVPSLAVADAFTREGNDGLRYLRFAVRLSAPSEESVRVYYATSNGSAKAPSDYRSRAGTLVFAPGEQLKRVRVAVHGDRKSEGRERMRLLLSAADGASLSRASARGTILDFD